MHLVDITMFFTPCSGGVRRYLLAKRTWLGRHTQHRHTLLAPGRRQEAGEGIVPLPGVRLPCGHGYRFPLRTAPALKKLCMLAPDVIEAGDPYRLAWAAIRAGQALSAPVVGFYHSDARRVLRYLLGHGAGRAIDRYLSHLYKQFDLVLAPSRAMCESLQDLGVTRVVQQPLGVDTRVFHPRRRDPGLRAELGLPPDTRLLIYAGRANADKNIPVLSEAVRQLGRPYHLLLVGNGFGFDRRSNVTCRTYQQDERELARLLAGSDALVHAGDKETFGLIVAEAMASGIPAVALDKDPLAELVTADTGVLVPTLDAQAFAQGIEALYQADLPALGRNARRRAKSRWTWDRLMPDLLTHYARLTRTRLTFSAEIMHAAHR